MRWRDYAPERKTVNFFGGGVIIIQLGGIEH